jgi:transcriptional regulator with XRE-family HTH domain
VKDEGKEKEESENEIFGKLVKKYREETGLSQSQLAADVGCTKEYISEIENGKANITFKLANRIGARFRLNFKNALRELKPDNSNEPNS